jgi:hypothetical protein
MRAAPMAGSFLPAVKRNIQLRPSFLGYLRPHSRTRRLAAANSTSDDILGNALIQPRPGSSALDRQELDGATRSVGSHELRRPGTEAPLSPSRSATRAFGPLAQRPA